MVDKKDRVITMEDFEAAARGRPEVDSDPKDMLDQIKEANYTKLVVMGSIEDGRMGFFSNLRSYEEILFFLEAYKKILMDGLVRTREYEEDV